MAREGKPGIRRVLVSTAILIVICFISLATIEPPASKPASAPLTEFSAARAFTVLQQLVGDSMPHPVGSAANDAVRGRIVEKLKSLGYQPEVQTAFECNGYGSCATVNNVIASLQGADVGAASAPHDPVGNPAVLLAAHYDSVAAGPGASDDGAGVAAVIEIARALQLLPRPHHSIVLLVDDGEEAGLLGARAFVEFHPWAKDVRAAVNLDARGTSGSSLMFETGSANEWAVRLYARGVSRPETSSLFYAVYKRLPNDTDFTVFKSAGYQGMNFAIVGNVVHYHTPLDNISNVDLGSLQQQGENGLSALLALANADLSNIPKGDDVYFSLFHRGIVRWPAGWTLPFAILAALLLGFQVGWLLRNRRLTQRQFLWGLAGWLVIVVLTGLLALVLARLIRVAGAMPVNWVAHPVPAEVTFCSLAVAVTTTAGILFASRAGFWGLWAGIWTWWAILSIALAWKAAEISYLVLIPTGVAALAGLPFVLSQREAVGSAGAALPSHLPLAAAGIVGIVPTILFYDGLGNRGLPLIAAFVALLLTPAAPLCADLLDVAGPQGAAFAVIPIAATILAAFATIVTPSYSARAPERLNIQYWRDADSGKAQWVVQPDSGRLPEPIRVAAAFERTGRGPFPWDPGATFLAEAPRLPLPAPTFTILESSLGHGRRIYRALLRSERGAPIASVLFPPGADAESAVVQGRSVELESDRERGSLRGWEVIRCLTMDPEGVEIDFTLPVGKLVDVFAADATFGLPAAGKFLLAARSLAVTPEQEGDVSIVSRRVQLIP